MTIQTSLPPVERDTPGFTWCGVHGHAPFLKIRRIPNENEPVALLDDFLDNVLESRRRIWILDRYFDVRYGLEPLWEYLTASQVREVRIISNKKSELDQWIAQRNSKMMHLETRALSRIINTMQVSVHDRFALVDDELWHFGSTVGGGHPGLSAATHGWRSQRYVLEYVFTEIWEGYYAR